MPINGRKHKCTFMKTTLLFTIALTTGILFTVPSYAKINSTEKQVVKIDRMVTDTPYLVNARIARVSKIDTPYLFIVTNPSTVYNEVEKALEGQTGLFKVTLVFYSETGMPVRNEQYYIRMSDAAPPLKYNK
jgi:hypothetical protein